MFFPMSRNELWVRLPPDLCILTEAQSAPAAIAVMGKFSPK